MPPYGRSNFSVRRLSTAREWVSSCCGTRNNPSWTHCNTCWLPKGECYDQRRSDALRPSHPSQRPPPKSWYGGSRPTAGRGPPHWGWNANIRTDNAPAATSTTDNSTALAKIDGDIKALEAIKEPSTAISAAIESLRNDRKALAASTPTRPPSGRELDKLKHKINEQDAKIQRSRDRADDLRRQLQEVETLIPNQIKRREQLQAEHDSVAAELTTGATDSRNEAVAFRPRSADLKQLLQLIQEVSGEHPCEQYRPAITRVARFIDTLAAIDSPVPIDVDANGPLDSMDAADLSESDTKPFYDAVSAIKDLDSSSIESLHNALGKSFQSFATRRQKIGASSTPYGS